MGVPPHVHQAKKKLIPLKQKKTEFSLLNLAYRLHFNENIR
ncbi:hypothetical protein H175_285p028 (plasmid) [Bacillus thuringiensis serovar thuringiensis str. IS5056]|nr:hypothetical protein H175_285p028 [Bacillus thuringiensis serovar thuringiensis str. IS5056]